MKNNEEETKQPLISFADGVAIVAVLCVAIGAGCYSWPLSLIVIGVAMLAGWWMWTRTDDSDNVDKTADRG
jgi:uncharacterized membrane protein